MTSYVWPFVGRQISIGEVEISKVSASVAAKTKKSALKQIQEYLPGWRIDLLPPLIKTEYTRASM